MNQIGDLLFSLPALYNLRARYPNAHISSIVRPSCRELLSCSGLADEIIERPHGSTADDLRLARSLRGKHTDLALLFSTSVAVWAMALLSGARARVGFTHSLGGLFLTKRVPWSEPPSTQNNLKLVEAIGCPIVKDSYVGLVKPDKHAQDEAEKILQSVGLAEGFTVIAPGTSGGREIKAWSSQGFAQVADRLASEHGLKTMVVGLKGRKEICSLSRNAVDLTGKTPLPVLAAILERAKIFVGVDSGLMHLAAAMGTPVVGLFGPTNPDITGPQGEGHAIVSMNLPCSPCLKSECREPVCMNRITPEQVMESVK